ncbi:hypothetical protein SAMD00024442_69_10 [Candidatus Symbiothrix dinenymphae]|nr:hypothetical protein SAMD00024442_69_10 [Candidatus Symbiothrix dinenymphae]
MENKILDVLQAIKNIALLAAKDVLNMDEAVLYTGLKEGYIYKLVSAKKIPYYKSVGGKLNYFKKQDLTDWLLSCRYKTTDEIESDAAMYVGRR